MYGSINQSINQSIFVCLFVCLSVVVEQVCEVGRGLVMEGFVGEEEELEVDSMWDREPV